MPCVALLGLAGALALPALATPADAAPSTGATAVRQTQPAASGVAQPFRDGRKPLTATTTGLRSRAGLPLTGQRTDGTHAQLFASGKTPALKASATGAVYSVTYGSASTTKSTWTVNYGTGFTSGSDAQLAFARAVSTWSTIVSSSVPIVVDAQLTAFSNKAQLGGAGPATFFGPSDGPFYPVALANAIQGTDLDKTGSDISADFSSNNVFYYGSTPDGIQSSSCSDAPEGCYDFESVVLHELGHGLGFLGTGDAIANGGGVYVEGTYGLNGDGTDPLVYDEYVELDDHTPFLSYPAKTSLLLSVLQSNRLWWDGPYGAAADRGREPRLYAPSSFEEGSTYSHLSESAYPTGDGALNGDPDALMTPQINADEVERFPGQIAIGVLEDIGWQATVLPGSKFTPITPTRILDTGSTKVANGGVKTVTVTGANGVPADATAVIVNITSALPTDGDYVQAYPVSRTLSAGGVAPLPVTSNLNASKGENRANLSTVPVGANGQISFKNYGGATRLVADIAGYYSPESTSGFNPVAPVRVMDTRSGVGVRKGKVGTGGVVSLTVTGAHGVPADATAVTLTLTAIKPNQPTYLQSYPAGASPTTSSLNLNRGETTANQVVVKVGDNGQVIFRNSTGSTDIIADLAGWYGPEDSGQLFRPTLPERVEDTRPNTLKGGRTLDEYVSDNSDVDVLRGIPTTATAGVLNLTGTAATLPTYLQVYPPATNAPTVSNLNLAKRQTAASSATVLLGSDKVRIRNYAGAVGVLLDLQGWFGPAS